MVFVNLFDNFFVIPKFEYFFTGFVYDFSVLSCGFVFANDCDFSNLLLLDAAQVIQTDGSGW